MMDQTFEKLKKAGWKRANTTHWYNPDDNLAYPFSKALEILNQVTTTIRSAAAEANSNFRVVAGEKIRPNYNHLPKVIRVFVYGSLLHGLRLAHYLKGAKYIDKDSISGFKLYNLEAYPGIARSDNGKVIGEIYEITPEILRTLDGVEQVGYLYNRSFGQTDSGIEVFVYDMNLRTWGPRLKPEMIIIDGDWRNFITVNGRLDLFGHDAIFTVHANHPTMQRIDEKLSRFEIINFVGNLKEKSYTGIAVEISVPGAFGTLCYKPLEEQHV